MASMSYCRMENTNGEIVRCINQVQDAIEKDMSIDDFRANLSSDYERRGFDYLYEHCKEFIDAVETLRDMD